MNPYLPDSLTGQLAARLIGTSYVDDQRASLHLLDWLGCVAGARRSPILDTARKAERDPVMRAAYLGNILEMDDVHRTALLHPGPVVWPATLIATRETIRQSKMKRSNFGVGVMTTAAIHGYEVMIAIGKCLDAHHYRYFHNTATAGVFGAAAAASSAFGGIPWGTIVHALGNAGSVAGGLWQMRNERVMTKQWHIAHAVSTGLQAARLAEIGCAGPAYILEGPQGLLAATTASRPPSRMYPPDFKYDPSVNWLIYEVSFKPWAACRHAHAAVDAALLLRESGALDHGTIEVATYRDALTFCDLPEPTTTNEAKFSLQHAVAVVAVRGRPTLSDFEPAAINDPTIIAARARIRVREDRKLSKAYPAHFGARVRASGQEANVADALGDPERSLDREAIVAKARALIAWGGLPESEADRAERVAFGYNDVPFHAVEDMLADWLK